MEYNFEEYKHDKAKKIYSNIGLQKTVIEIIKKNAKKRKVTMSKYLLDLMGKAQ